MKPKITPDPELSKDVKNLVEKLGAKEASRVMLTALKNLLKETEEEHK